MTEEQRRDVEKFLDVSCNYMIVRETAENVQAYRLEFERMRAFIAQLTDEVNMFTRGDG